jgi:hypothetical protein
MRDSFEECISLLNICEAISGTHFPFVEHPSKRITLTLNDFYNNFFFCNIVVQVMCNANKIFWNVCANQPTRVRDGEQFKNSSFCKPLRYHMISQEPMIIGGFRCTPYLIGNVVYPIHKYL